MDEVPQDVAERRYERWVMRAAELMHGDYPKDVEEAEHMLLVRMRDSLVAKMSSSDFWGEESTSEGVGGYVSEHGEGDLEAARSLVFDLYSAAGGEEWSLVVEAQDGGETPSVSVRGFSLDAKGTRVDLTVDPNSLACRDASDLRALHGRIAKELPRRELAVEEAANEALEAVEEMQGMLEGLRESSYVLDTREEMRGVRAALENLWMVLTGIAAVEEDRRLRGKEEGRAEGKDAPDP